MTNGKVTGQNMPGRYNHNPGQKTGKTCSRCNKRYLQAKHAIQSMRDSKHKKQNIIASFVGVFCCVVLCFSWSSSKAQMETLLADKSDLALQFDLAIRSYVSETIRPFAQAHTDNDVFIPDVMSTSFVARCIFEKVRKQHPDYTIKFSSDNPRNPLNQARPEELKIIEYFNNNPDAKTWSGEITLNGKKHIGLFSARRMTKRCLQ